MSKKRTSLDSVFGVPDPEPIATVEPLPDLELGKGPRRPGIKQQTAYLPEPVYEQLRRLSFEERRKMHTYILEGLDRVFSDRGLPSIKEITKGAV